MATLYSEPLHLLVKQDLVERVTKDFKELSGKSINLGPVDTGTNRIATHLLTVAGRHVRNTGRNEGYAVATYRSQTLGRPPAAASPQPSHLGWSSPLHD